MYRRLYQDELKSNHVPCCSGMMECICDGYRAVLLHALAGVPKRLDQPACRPRISPPTGLIARLRTM
jgi:hypothetical protein